jgi:hypothetical protein
MYLLKKIMFLSVKRLIQEMVVILKDRKRAIVAYKDKPVTKTRGKFAQRKELKTQKKSFENQGRNDCST